MSNGNDGYSFQEMGSEDITGEKKGWRGEDAALRTKKMQWTWDEQSFEVGGSQKAKEDFEGQMGAFAWSASQSYSRKGFWKVGEDPRAAGTNVWTVIGKPSTKLQQRWVHRTAQAWDKGPAKHIMLHKSGWEKQSWEELHNSESKEEVNMPSLPQEMESVRRSRSEVRLKGFISPGHSKESRCFSAASVKLSTHVDLSLLFIQSSVDLLMQCSDLAGNLGFIFLKVRLV